MTFDEYQTKAKTTAQYVDYIPVFVYLAMGLAGETGEVVEKLKKIVRNNKGVFSDEERKEIIKEMGDVVWYLSQLAGELGYSFNDVAEANLNKLFDRKKRGVIRSKGDNR